MHDELIDILIDFLGESKKHSPSKGQISFNCLLCDDGRGKGNLEINYIKGVYKCWSCYEVNHMSGTIPYLIRTYGSKQNISDFKLIEKNLNFDLEFKSISTEVITNLPEGFQSLLKKSTNYEYRLAMAYLLERKIGFEFIKKFNLGYCAIGKYAGRIIVPSYDCNDNVNYFVGRAYKKWIKPKYLNPDTDKTTIIFNEQLINWDAAIYLVEGPFDHLVVPNSICLLGKYLDLDYLAYEKILDKASADIIIVLDGDANDDAKKLYFKLNNGKLYNRVKVVRKIPYGYDISKIHELLGNTGVIKALRCAERISDCEEIH